MVGIISQNVKMFKELEYFCKVLSMSGLSKCLFLLYSIYVEWPQDSVIVVG